MTHDKIPSFSLLDQIAALKPELDEAWNRVLTSGQFILGTEVTTFENEVEALIGVPAVGVANGSDALYLALQALQIGPGDEVVTTAFSFFATAGSISRLGATPVFADVDPDTFNVDPDQALARVTPRTRAILPVHLFGLMADTLRLVQGFSGPIVEDAAQAILAAQNGRWAGTVGDIGCFSFFPTKNLGAFGDGGLVTSRRPELAEVVRTLRVHGATAKYYHERLGVNARLDALQAAILRVKLRHLQEWTARRLALADRYRHGIRDRGLDGFVRPQAIPPGYQAVYHQFTVRAERRDALQRFLGERGIGSTVYYPHPLHLLPVFQSLGHRAGDFPVAETLCREVLSLPLYPELRDDQVDRVVEALSDFYHDAA
ncbi:MAG: DegT/DnrJ/EryC1/StrS family aminotransferase [Clostridia bacterium]